MKKMILIGLISLAGTLAQAQDNPAYEAAAKVCAGLPTSYLQQDCFSKIKGKVFDQQVVDICALQPTPYLKVNCLQLVEGKKFLSSTEVNSCRVQSTSYLQFDCLKNASKTKLDPQEEQVLTMQKVADQIDLALFSLQNGNPDSAKMILYRLRLEIIRQRN